jgi:hypothetical protein
VGRIKDDWKRYGKAAKSSLRNQNHRGHKGTKRKENM